MILFNKKYSSFGLYKSIYILLLFSILTLVARINPIEVPPGITITLTSIFLLVILRLFSLKAAAYTFVIVHVISFIFFNLSPWNLIPLLELIFIAIVFKYRPKSNIVFWGALFWLIIGAPLSAWIHSSIFGLNNDTLFIFETIKVAINGVLNILVFDIIISYIPFHRYLTTNKKQQTIQLKKIMFHLSFVAMIVPFILYIIVNTANYMGSLEVELYKSAQRTTSQVEAEINSWHEADLLQLQLFGIVQQGQLNDLLDQITDTRAFEHIVANESGQIISSNSSNINNKDKYDWQTNHQITELTSNFYQVLSNENVLSIQNWESGYYIYETEMDGLPLTVYAQIPLHPYQIEILGDFLGQFIYLFLFLFFALILTIFLHRILSRTLNNLAITTTGLPRKIKNLESVKWPNSSILEINALISNFQDMSVNVEKMFIESNNMNEKLTKQSEMLKKSEDKLHHLAYHDVLTDLPNRQYFQRYLSSLLEDAKQKGLRFAIIFMDLNQFKQINDTLGHLAGDELLKIIANNLKNLKNEKNEVFRLSGDEFVIVINNLISEQEAEETAINIQGIFQEPVKVNDHLLHISGSIGISLFPDDGSDETTLIQNADIAMYTSKEKAGTSIEFFDHTMKSTFTEKVNLTNELRTAVDNSQFQLFYQPKVDNNGYITSSEALIRWQNDIFGDVSPSVFIPLAEDVGLIKNIDEWVINEACKQNKIWQDQGYSNIKVSVNISAKHFYQSQLVNMIKKALFESQLNAKYLQIEITESVFIDNIDNVISIIEEIRELGVSVSIDDFGKGFSMLSHLISLPINEVKLDKQFIRNIDKEANKAIIVSHIVMIAHELEFNVVAEGVETFEEYTHLKQIDCDELQGFYFSKAVNKKDFQKLLQAANLLNN
ncbi:putative bifunctional diguanylate cyclase/phosphodiesterase [Salipaludibacillus sp. HK11]|uniref:putative bifunctional diguanylate cyclase/phosphodiesterase n=1 Tax=Salipaludibacillus sp. HK11 TaxID=3394320 RepID=UPI0039FDA683